MPNRLGFVLASLGHRWSPRLRLLPIGAGVGVAGALALILLGIVLRPGAPQGVPAGVPVRGSTMGNPDAPVIVEEYADFQCHFCALFVREIGPTLVEEYVATGKVLWVFRHFPILGLESFLAAAAAEAAAEQERFWPYYELLFSAQSGVDQGAFSPERLTDMARQAGLDMDAFDAFVKSKASVAKMEQDLERGRAQGVQFTPTFIITGRVMEGAQPIEVFYKVIEGAEPIEIFREVIEEALEATGKP